MEYITVEDVTSLFRILSSDEEVKAQALIPVVCASLRQEARQLGYNLECMIEQGEIEPDVLKSVCVDIVSRALLTSTNSEPMTNVSQSALGYSFSGTFLNPGGGLFIKDNELARLGLYSTIGFINL